MEQTKQPPTHEHKYNRIMPQTTDKVLCIEVEKVISAEGYEENFLPRVKEMIDKYDEVRILVYYKNFKGWEYDAARQDMLTSAELGRKTKKLALVNPPESEVFQRTIKKKIVAGDMKCFNESDFDDALKWVSE